jgi:phage shock protein A
VEKKRFGQMITTLDQDLLQHSDLLNQYRDDIAQLEEKLHKAKEKQHMLIQRHIHARRAQKAQQEIRRMDNYETIAKFEELESRIDRMEAEAELVNPIPKTNLDNAFHKLIVDEEIEKELSQLKASRNASDQSRAASE